MLLGLKTAEGVFSQGMQHTFRRWKREEYRLSTRLFRSLLDFRPVKPFWTYNPQHCKITSFSCFKALSFW